MASTDSTDKKETKETIIESLNCASTKFGFKLPTPVGSIYKRALESKEGQGIIKKVKVEPRSEDQDLQRSNPVEKHEINFKSNAKESYRSFIIRDKWALLERQTRLTDIKDPLPALKMPLICLTELKDLLHAKFGFETSQGHTITITEDSLHQAQDGIETFMAEVERTRILAISIASNSHENEKPGLSCPEVKKEEMSHEISCVAFNGIILKFSDILLMPYQLRNILCDVAYAKLSSSPDRDCQLLQRFGIRLRGWIHSGAVYHALLNTESKYDIQTQAKFLETQGYVGASELSMMESTNLVVTQDYAWVPLAITMASAINFAVKRGYPDSKQMFPVIWEAVDLVRLRVPEDLDQLSNDPIRNWMVGMICDEDEEHRNVNHVLSMLRFRRMSADFVETFDPSFNPIEAAMYPYQLFLSPTSRVILPPPRFLKCDNIESYLEVYCKTCGTMKHTGHRCREQRGKQPVCNYPHEDALLPSVHPTKFCPELHHCCLDCRVLGHHESVHEKRNLTLRELRERFFQHAHLGFLTSLPYLFLIHEVQSKLRNFHFRTGFLALTMNHDAITRYQLGIGPKECAHFAKPYNSYEDKDDMVALRTELIRLNAETDNPEYIFPIPRNIFRDILKARNEYLLAKKKLLPH